MALRSSAVVGLVKFIFILQKSCGHILPFSFPNSCHPCLYLLWFFHWWICCCFCCHNCSSHSWLLDNKKHHWLALELIFIFYIKCCCCFFVNVRSIVRCLGQLKILRFFYFTLKKTTQFCRSTASRLKVVELCWWPREKSLGVWISKGGVLFSLICFLSTHIIVDYWNSCGLMLRNWAFK